MKSPNSFPLTLHTTATKNLGYKTSFSKLIILTLVLIFITKFFQSTPFEKEFFQIQAGFIVLMGFYYIKEVFNFRRYSNEIILKYFLFLIPFVFFYNAFRANEVFGQSYYLGLLSQRGVFLIMLAFWIYKSILKNRYSFEELEKYFIWFGWISFFIFTYIYFFVDPNSFIDSSFANYDPARGYRYKFQTGLVTFITLYYLVKYRNKSKISALLFFIILIAFAIFVISGRAHLLILLFVSLLIFISGSKKISNFLKLSILIIFGAFTLYFISTSLFPEFLPNFLNSLNQAFEVLGGNLSEDASANSRIYQSEIIFDFLSKNPASFWFGVGNLSNHFGSEEITGFNYVFGYLYPTDTGLIGVLFQLGIFGFIIVYFIPFLIIIKLVRKTKSDSIFISALLFYLIYSLIASLYTGNLAFDPYFIYFVLGIILAYRKLNDYPNSRAFRI